jgi:hypothetical protein
MRLIVSMSHRRSGSASPMRNSALPDLWAAALYRAYARRSERSYYLVSVHPGRPTRSCSRIPFPRSLKRRRSSLLVAEVGLPPPGTGVQPVSDWPPASDRYGGAHRPLNTITARGPATPAARSGSRNCGSVIADSDPQRFTRPRSDSSARQKKSGPSSRNTICSTSPLAVRANPPSRARGRDSTARDAEEQRTSEASIRSEAPQIE